MAEILEWTWREAGKKYLSRLEPPYPEMCDACIAFVGGDHWRNIETEGVPTPVINMTNRALQFNVAYLTSNNVRVQLGKTPYVQMPPDQNGLTPIDICQAEIDRLFEEWNMTSLLRDALTKAGMLGDSYAHLWFEADEKPFGGTVEGINGTLCLEILPGNAVMFGNANCSDIERQPWVILQGRDSVSNLRAEAERMRTGADGDITSDKDYAGVAGDASQIEIEIEGDEWGKAAYAIVYKYDKAAKKVTMTKCTKDAYIFKDVVTAFTTYPISRLAWEDQEGQFHGRGIVQTVIPNNISINRMLAMVIYHQMLTAFSKTVYDADLITEGWSNEIGQAIPVHGNSQGRSLDSVAKSISPGEMSAQIITALKLLMEWTKESIGMSDSAMGSVNPEQASGAAIVASAKQATIPLENVRTHMHAWLERIGRIVLDGMAGYYGVRPVAVGEGEEQQIVRYDFTALRGIWMLVKSDVGASSYYSEEVQQRNIDNLLAANRIEFIDWLERVDDVYLRDKQGLIQKIKAGFTEIDAQKGGQKAIAAPVQQGVSPDEYEIMAQFVDGLSPELQKRLDDLMKRSPQEYENTVKQMMQGA